MAIETIVSALRRWATTAPDCPAYHLLGEDDRIVASLNYGRLDRQAQTIAAQISRHKLPPDACALVMYPEGLDFITAFMGCLYAGVIAVPTPFAGDLRSAQDAQRLQAIAADAGAALLLTNRAGDQAVDLPIPRIITDTLPAADEEAWEPAAVLESVAYIQYTSGSTAAPKGIAVTHANLAHSLEELNIIWGYAADSAALTWMPHVHDFGLVEGLLHPLAGGIPCTIMSPWAFVRRPARWLQAISRYRISHSGAATFAYDWCVKRTTPEQCQGLDLHSWQMAMIGAEPIRPAIIERFAATFSAFGFDRESFCPGYGLAETTLLATAKSMGTPVTLRELTIGAVQTRLTSCGYPHGYGQVLVVNPETRRPCRPGEVGEIWLAGPKVAAGYWRNPEATQETFQARLADSHEGPFLRTGDLGVLDQGELFITGRLKDMIIIRGQNYYPQDIEWALAGCHPAGESHLTAAFSVPEADGEQIVIAQEVDHRRWPEETWVEFIAAIRRRLAEHLELPVLGIVLLRRGDLLKTSSGKLQRYACRAAYLAGEWQPVAAWRRPELEESSEKNPADADVVTRLSAIWQELLHTPVGPNDNFFALGGDSLTALQMALAVEEQFNIQVGTAFFRNPTISYLATLLDPEAAATPAAAPSPMLHRAPRAAYKPLIPPRGRFVREGPIFRSRTLLPYGLGVHLQRAWLAVPAIQQLFFKNEITLLQRWGERIGTPPDAKAVLQSLLANTWRDWRKQILTVPLGASPWVQVQGDPLFWQPQRSSTGVIFMPMHTPLAELFLRGLTAGGVRYQFVRGATDETETRSQDRALQLYQAGNVLAQGGVVIIAGDGGKGRQRVVVPFFGGQRPFLQGSAELAVQTGAALVPVFCTIATRGKVEINVCPPLERGTGSDRAQVDQLTRAYADLVVERWPHVYACLSWENLARWLASSMQQANEGGTK